jgi:hypothetical protein
MSTEQTFEEKIKTLREIHSRSHPDAVQQISQWEDKFARLRARKDWLEHPNTMELRNLATEQIDIIVGILAEKEDLSDDDRKKLFAQKQAHLVYLTVLTDDPESEIKSVESSVDAELTDIK